ncbi:DUF6599 family protein [Chondromyces apiculatus]|uniref:Lipoprotein n=1 Tax=Chondromyces apiculatus DSM 436 TaxID=1192034 RepID=A0A017SXJ9_9BACT|nr:DUF6599 family protein [Chondromyces apiculatus]EYF01709.1 Hypothetical protein CAP_7914 [Chondromyces apiculatus DSM 436]
MRASLLAIGAAACVLSSGCKDDEPPRAPPPPPIVAKADACAGGGGKSSDPSSAAFFPRVTGRFCLDPNGVEKTFGEGASLPLDGICDMFDGECEIYKGFNVRRVVEARYVDGGGTTASIEVHLSKFAGTEGAYAMFTKRVVGDGDPADEATPRPLDAGGAAALGLGNAYLWRGLYLAEITYSDESAAEAVLKVASDKALPPLVKEMGEKLPGEVTLPSAADRLPKENRLPLGIRYALKDILGVDGVGGGAFGYYRDGEKRYRVLALVREDADQAKDTLASFAKQPGATREKGIEGGIVRVMHKEGEAAPTEWLLARANKMVIGVGDESRVLRAGMTAEEHAKVSLTREEKLKRLKTTLGGT